jgi:hypothetical protein
LAEAKTRYANYLARERREMVRSRMITFLVMMLTTAIAFLFFVFLV